jgi:hypothetical protein
VVTVWAVAGNPAWVFPNRDGGDSGQHCPPSREGGGLVAATYIGWEPNTKADILSTAVAAAEQRPVVLGCLLMLFTVPWPASGDPGQDGSCPCVRVEGWFLTFPLEG